MISLTINGKKTELDANLSVQEFLAQKNLKPLMVVVEMNGVILSRDVYNETFLQEGDTLEIVQMMAGG